MGPRLLGRPTELAPRRLATIRRQKKRSSKEAPGSQAGPTRIQLLSREEGAWVAEREVSLFPALAIGRIYRCNWSSFPLQSVGFAAGSIRVFETLFLSRTLDPWYSNELSRLVKTPKLFFLDSGLLAALRNVSPRRVGENRGVFGPLLETFVLAELLKLAGPFGSPLDFFHFRDKDRNEVDIVIEDADRRVVGVEIKAAATVSGSDFKGMEKLAQACGERFALGLVLYDHHQTVPFGEKMFAAPIATLWG